MNPAIAGGVIARIFDIIHPFHKAFFSPGGLCTNTNTKAADNLGLILDGALQMFTLGVTLTLTPSSLKAKPTVWVLLVRYVFMPAISMGAVWSTAGRGRFLLILVPSALLLLNAA
ncbi:hypothetical protein FIBSPDRAFT_945633 [Athelia psychrophila]|uniref:Uncharacterized protein n=1 Tax=Athelia psychrophila TaxID=1759441 RepID=A0A166TK91_9AGAM|nr:hypothetical protein FIBSPDRAFT_945633 [Fibularhizoctonia sp. CBS 109695]